MLIFDTILSGSKIFSEPTNYFHIMESRCHFFFYGMFYPFYIGAIGMFQFYVLCSQLLIIPTKLMKYNKNAKAIYT